MVRQWSDSDEKTINEHLKKVKHLIRGDHINLVNTAMTLQGYTANVTNLLQVHNMFQVTMKQVTNVTTTDVYKTIMFNSLRQQRQLYYKFPHVGFKQYMC